MGMTGIKEHISDFLRREFENYKNQGPAFGMFFSFTKTIVPTDPELLKEIFVRNFTSFHDHGLPFNEKTDPLANNLFFINGQAWKDLRAKLSPIFTSGRLKIMFPIVVSKADRMIEFLKSHIKMENYLEFNELFGAYTTEAIASLAFGIETKCLGNPDNGFRKEGRRIFEPTVFETMKKVMGRSSKTLVEHLGLYFIPKSVTRFFTDALMESFEYRKGNNFKRDDFLQIAMDIMKNDKNFTIEKTVANCFVYLFAG